MRIGRAITAGTMALGAWKAYQEYKGHHDDTPHKRGRSRGGTATKQKKGWFGTPFSIRH
jgi:hypothetical protein